MIRHASSGRRRRPAGQLGRIAALAGRLDVGQRHRALRRAVDDDVWRSAGRSARTCRPWRRGRPSRTRRSWRRSRRAPSRTRRRVRRVHRHDDGPAEDAARSTSVNSTRVLVSTPTRSPGSRPRPISPWAIACTRAHSSRERHRRPLAVAQERGPRRRRSARPPSSSAPPSTASGFAGAHALERYRRRLRSRAPPAIAAADALGRRP